MKFCNLCGSQLDDNMSFCNNCGAPVESSGSQVNFDETQVLSQLDDYQDQGNYNNYQQPNNYQPQSAPYQANQYQEAPYQPNQYQNIPQQNPVYSNNPQPSQMTTAGKILGIISMVLGINGLVSGVSFLFMSLSGLITACDIYKKIEDIKDNPFSYFYNYGFSTSALETDCENAITLSVMSIIFAFIGIAFAVAALILSSKAKKNGNTTKLPTIGKNLSIPTFAVSAITMILSIVTFIVLFLISESI